VTEIMDMPVLSAFLAQKNEELHIIAVEAILRSTASRVLSTAMSISGAEIADLGVNEMEEGLIRLAAAEGLAERSDELAEEGADLMVAGINELEESDMLDDAAKDMAADGVADVAVGAAELGASDVLGVMAEEDEY